MSAGLAVSLARSRENFFFMQKETDEKIMKFFEVMLQEITNSFYFWANRYWSSSGVRGGLMFFWGFFVVVFYIVYLQTKSCQDSKVPSIQNWPDLMKELTNLRKTTSWFLALVLFNIFNCTPKRRTLACNSLFCTTSWVLSTSEIHIVNCS